MTKYIALILLLVTFLSCNRNDEVELSDNAYVNQWIQEEMDFWYFWQSALDADLNKELEPPLYFEEQLLEADRFSYLAEDYRELQNSLQGISRDPGYEFQLYRTSMDSQELVGQILYIKPESAASGKGLKRGDIFNKINGTQLTLTNYENLLQAIRSDHTLSVEIYDYQEEAFGPEETVEISPFEYSENPNFMDTVFQVDGRTIGYYVYNFFATGTSDNPGSYQDQMNQVFLEFQSAAITDLIIDLRYNSGGSESASIQLASLVKPNPSEDEVFSRLDYNDQVNELIINDPDFGEAALIRNFREIPANVGDQLNESRVYVLTGSRTASASEILINGLEPYMDVVLVGDTTVGKNVGSITIFEENDPRNTWGLQPIVVQFVNANDFGDYIAGIVPDILLTDNNLIKYPLGDVRETLLLQTITEITGTAVAARQLHSIKVGTPVRMKVSKVDEVILEGNEFKHLRRGIYE